MRIAFTATAQILRACVLFLLASAPLLAPVLAQEAADRPPVKRVVVYDTGVAFIEHEGKVSGAKELTLDLPDRDVNDLLKSMVVQDLGGGRISWAALPTSTTKAPPLQIAERKTLVDFLGALRGMRVRVGAAAPVEGELLIVEFKQDEKTHEVKPQLTILTDAGAVRVDLGKGEAVQLVEPAQQRAMEKSVELMNPTRDQAATRIRMKCEGEGERQVRVGYVAASPIWKASYRLVLRNHGKSMLQAWALVENDTQNDWRDIECTLVSGRGLGFQTDLRTPLNIKRPYRSLERFSAVAPEAHVAANSRKLEDQAAILERNANSPDGAMSGQGMGGMGGMGVEESDATPTEMSEMLNRRLARWRAASASSPSSLLTATQVSGRTTSSNSGESIRYQLKGAVSIAKGETALLHISDAELEGKEIALFNPSVDTSHPLHAIQLANPSEGALAAGPISIFAGDSYRGDAIVGHWPAGEKRLISYAIDSQLKVSWKSEETPLEYLGVLVTDDDELVFVTRESLKGAYIVDNRSPASRTCWIEHPRFDEWSLIAPSKVAEESADRYRLEIEVDAGKQASLPLEVSRYRLLWPEDVEQRLSEKEIAEMKVFTESVRKALAMPQQREEKESKVLARMHAIDDRAKELREDQIRLRETLKALANFPEQAKSFIEKLLASEKQLEELETEKKSLGIVYNHDEERSEVAEIEKEYDANWSELLLKIKVENPLDKLPYKPTPKEIDDWRRRQSLGMGGMGGMGGGMGGMGGAGFF